jgi:hypothetical protein
MFGNDVAAVRLGNVFWKLGPWADAHGYALAPLRG